MYSRESRPFFDPDQDSDRKIEGLSESWIMHLCGSKQTSCMSAWFKAFATGNDIDVERV
jgi:hypothetical protein